MNIVNICCYAEGYHSGASYEENIAITEKTYNEIRSEIEKISIFCGELDGKHSNVKAYLEIQNLDEAEVPYTRFEENNNDGDRLYNKMKEVFTNHGLDIDKEIEEVKNYIQTLDCMTSVGFDIKQSDVNKVKEYVESLGYIT